jgi:hypothetical protein
MSRNGYRKLRSVAFMISQWLVSNRLQPVAPRISILCLAVCAALIGCQTPQQTFLAGTAGATILGGMLPAQQIEQVYYLGAFDPQEQVPPAIYRITVRGQASFISRMQFGSGWVPAATIDSLGTRLSFEDGNIAFNASQAGSVPSLELDRRMILFGPEGFREAPKDHRLVIVMGSSPEAFFNAIDRSLNVIAQTTSEQYNQQMDLLLFAAQSHMVAEQGRIGELQLGLQSMKAPVAPTGASQ